MLAAVIQNGNILEYASDELKGDREIVLAAVSQSKYALYSASVELKGDREIVLAAVSQSKDALQYASDALRYGSLREYVDGLINQYNVSKQTFIATILFGSKPGSHLSKLDGQKYAYRLIGDYAGVRSGERWRVIEAAAGNLGIEIPG